MEKEPAPSPLTSLDVTLLQAARVWGGEFADGLWARFPAERRSSLRWGWESGQGGDPDSALDQLRREHASQARPELTTVHPSWWARALKDETASVRRAVVANLPPDIAAALQDDLGFSTDDLTPDRPAEPGSLRVALALWTVQLVGDLSERHNDPPVIVALTRLDAPSLARLIQTTGLAKWSITSRPSSDLDPKALDRLAPLRASLADLDTRFLQVANSDLESSGTSALHAVAQAGMTSFARLLLAADPFRMRWALQHVPYKTAKALRSVMGPAGRKAPMLVRWETSVLRAAWTQLYDEGRLSVPWKDAS